MTRELLTKKEYEVAALAALGYTTKEIAHEFFVSHRTVESHLSNTYKKLGIKGKYYLPMLFASDLSLYRIKSSLTDRLNSICTFPMTVRELALLAGCSKHTAWSYLKRKGLFIPDVKPKNKPPKKKIREQKADYRRGEFPIELNKNYPPLTKREYEIAVLAFYGTRTKTIASELDLHVSTIQTHLNKIYRKLQIKGRHQLPILFASFNGRFTE